MSRWTPFEWIMRLARNSEVDFRLLPVLCVSGQVSAVGQNKQARGVVVILLELRVENDISRFVKREIQNGELDIAPARLRRVAE